MLKALHYCHNVIQVIHRDIKPENIMINHNKEAVLIDFGISFLVDQQENDEMKTINIGTFNYYAPEMWVK
jgi:serine/threonine-protein kinase